MPLRKVMISGGGTGGHIFPAIAIANALKKRDASLDIMFVGAEGRMEMEKVPAAGYKIIGLKITGMPRTLFTAKWFSFAWNLMNSLSKAKKMIQEFKPDVVVGVGGYASGPLLKVATGKKIPSVIQEQNSFPGKTNKLLAEKVNKICVAYDGLDKWFPKEKLVLTGNPVREEVVQLEGKKARAAEFFQLDANKKTILVVGGSLGAKTINEAIKAGIENFKQQDVQLIWQTGKNYFEEAKKTVENSAAKNIRVYDFITKMDLGYAMADVVISRAGAIAISELCLVKKPVILVPSPNVAEDHQTKNAMALVNHNAAVLVKDAEAKNSLPAKVMELMNDQTKCDQLKNNITGMGFTNSADAIASVIFDLVN
ncbi:MAG: undecaprenyldiphospho-muramoylpentapeptide beta-N-acetylglucosaminyltransferase [Bacteroidota bacterium]